MRAQHVLSYHLIHVPWFSVVRDQLHLRGEQRGGLPLRLLEGRKSLPISTVCSKSLVRFYTASRI